MLSQAGRDRAKAFDVVVIAARMAALRRAILERWQSGSPAVRSAPLPAPPENP
jgi:hypothetical protein